MYISLGTITNICLPNYINAVAIIYSYTAPKIIQPPADFHIVTFNESTSSVLLMCSLNITIPSSVTVTWTHDNNSVMPHNAVIQTGNTTVLSIRNPQLSDAGLYQCVFGALHLQRIIVLGMSFVFH